MDRKNPRVVIVGGGFGGLAAAKALKNAPAEVILIDRSNHHLFQPLLYQVATSVLSPNQIASPIRNILRRQKNTTVVLAEVTGIDHSRRCVLARNVDRENVAVPYDYLIVATGAHHSYFGHDEFERYAPGLKTLADAATLRNRILQAFERAEASENPDENADLLTFVLVGGGPTGVELAGAIATLARQTLRSEFRRIDPARIRIVLLSGSHRILPAFSDKVAAAASARLKQLGVEIRAVTADRVDSFGAWSGDVCIPGKTVIWTAGVTGFPVGHWFEGDSDRSGRIRVDDHLRVPGRPGVFIVGDAALLEQDGNVLPGVAQVALQQGRFAGRMIARLAGGQEPTDSFRYFDKGTLAVVGKGFAVMQRGKFELTGSLAWLVWVVVHLQFLAQTSLRISVFLQWAWTYITWQRGARLIVTAGTMAPGRKAAAK